MTCAALLITLPAWPILQNEDSHSVNTGPRGCHIHSVVSRCLAIHFSFLIYFFIPFTARALIISLISPLKAIGNLFLMISFKSFFFAADRVEIKSVTDPWADTIGSQ